MVFEIKFCPSLSYPYFELSLDNLTTSFHILNVGGITESYLDILMLPCQWLKDCCALMLLLEIRLALQPLRIYVGRIFAPDVCLSRLLASFYHPKNNRETPNAPLSRARLQGHSMDGVQSKEVIDLGTNELLTMYSTASLKRAKNISFYLLSASLCKIFIQIKEILLSETVDQGGPQTNFF